jgi:hypothetical protein
MSDAELPPKSCWSWPSNPVSLLANQYMVVKIVDLIEQRSTINVQLGLS